MARGTILKVKNESGNTISAKKVVYISGFGDDYPTVGLADNTSENTMPAIGIVVEDIENNSVGTVRTIGLVGGFDTHLYYENDEIYVGTNGDITYSIPSSSSTIQQIGLVARSDVSGQIMVFPLPTEHSPASVAGAPLTISNQEITFNYDYTDFILSGNNLQIRDAGINHGLTSGLADDDHSQYLLLAGRNGQTIDDSITINSKLGIGIDTTSMATDRLLDIVASDDSLQTMLVHIGEQDNEGGYIGSFAPSDLMLSGGVDFVDGSWADRSGTGDVSYIRLLNGDVLMYAESGWDGSSQPTLQMKIDGGDNLVTIRNDLNIGDTTTSTASRILQIGYGRTGSGYSYIDLVGDTTYTDYGSRFIRTNNGANANTKIEHRGTGELALKANDAGSVNFYTQNTKRMFVESDGDVYIGDTTFGFEPNVGSSTAGTQTIRFNTNDATYNTGFTYDRANTLFLWVINNGTKMRLNANGDLGVGLSPSYRLDIKDNVESSYVANFFNDGNNANRYGITISAGADNGSGTTYYILCQDGNGDTVGYIENNGGTFRLIDPSDESLKVDIAPTDIDGLSVINSVEPVKFTRRKSGERVDIGFIAQNVQAIFPQAVSKGLDGKLGVSYISFIPVLLKAMRQQQEQIDRLMLEVRILRR